MNFIFSIKGKSLLVKSLFLLFLFTSVQTYGQSPPVCENNGQCQNGICTPNPENTSYYCECFTDVVSGVSFQLWGGALCDSRSQYSYFDTSYGFYVPACPNGTGITYEEWLDPTSGLVPEYCATLPGWACEADEHMTLSGCTACPEGTTNEAGDTILLGLTSCDAAPPAECGADEFVESGNCVACPAGTTNAEGDVPSGGDTFCAEIIACAGFEPPMDNYPVRVKKNRALPLKAELFDYEVVFAKTDADLTAPPVVQVMLNGAPTGEGDVSDDVLPAGQGSDGNQFVFTDEGKWQFNLKTGQFTAPGTYIVSMESGDPDVYTFVSQCVTEFEIK